MTGSTKAVLALFAVIPAGACFTPTASPLPGEETEDPSASSGSTSGGAPIGTRETDTETGAETDAETGTETDTETDTETGTETGTGTGVPYGDCVNTDDWSCDVGVCVTDGADPPQIGVCIVPDCNDVTECPPDPDGTLVCADLNGDRTSECYLGCEQAEDCPAGMACYSGFVCVWPVDPPTPEILFEDDFESGDLSTGGWTTVDADGLTPAPTTETWFSTGDAWIVGTTFWPASNTAIAHSWYAPPGTSDDWLISPPIDLLQGSSLSWRSRSNQAEYPSTFEVRISTTTGDVEGLLAEPALVVVEDQSTSWTERTIDLAALGYRDESVFIAFRNVTDDGYVLLIDDVRVSDTAASP